MDGGLRCKLQASKAVVLGARFNVRRPGAAVRGQRVDVPIVTSPLRPLSLQGEG